jgi:hypothetical protein
MSGWFGNMFFVSVLQVGCILFCFFLPEILHGVRGKDRLWHVPLASVLLIASVLVLTWVHGMERGAGAVVRTAEMAALDAGQAVAPTEPLSRDVSGEQLGEQLEEQAAQASSESRDTAVPSAAREVATRLGTMALPVNQPATLAMTIQNSGAAASFDCELTVFDATDDTESLPDAVDVLPLAVNPAVETNGTGHCSWRITPQLPGAFVLRASTRVPGEQETARRQEFLVEAHQDARGSFDALVHVYHSRIEGNDEALAARLRSAGFHNAKAKGLWETSSSEQFIFYRDGDKKHLDDLFIEIAMPEVQPYHFGGDNVGSKVKDRFAADNNLEFLVIVH